MKHSISALLLTFLVTGVAWAHAGHVHNFLGTVKALDGNQLVIVTTASKDAAFVLTPSTVLTRGTKAASRADLRPGTRVAVHVADDGRTATSVKLGE